MADELEWTCCNDQQTLFILFYIAFSSFAFVVLRTDVAKPLRMVSTFLHEYSHATACWLTGGDVKTIQVFHNEGGVTQYTGGWRCLIIPAGYLGSGIWAAVLVVLSGGRRTATVAAVVFIVALLAALCYSPNKTMVILNVCYTIVLAIFILVEWFVYSPILQFVILFFGVFIGIVALSDIHSDTIVRSVEGSDSHACHSEVCPCFMPRCIGVTWICIAIFLQVCAAWLALVEMSNECEDLGWFECIHLSVDIDYDLGWGEFDGFWDNGP